MKCQSSCTAAYIQRASGSRWQGRALSVWEISFKDFVTPADIFFSNSLCHLPHNTVMALACTACTTLSIKISCQLLVETLKLEIIAPSSKFNPRPSISRVPLLFRSNSAWKMPIVVKKKRGMDNGQWSNSSSPWRLVIATIPIPITII